MNLNNIFASNKLDETALLQYGFKIKDDKYILKKNLANSNFYIKISITFQTYEIKVYDPQNDEEYLPFNLKSPTGTYVAEIRKEVNSISEDVIKKCFINNDYKVKILNYVKAKYNTIPEYPWNEYPTFCTLKADNKKWYGLLMNIPYKSISINRDGNIDVINVKLNSDKIKNLLDNKNYFPAYHMNKKYWITILLNTDLKFEKLTELIDESYRLICKK